VALLILALTLLQTLWANAVCSNSNECYLAGIDHLNVPSLTTSANGTGTLVQYGGANAGWVQASGGTYNSVEKIDTFISTIQGKGSCQARYSSPPVIVKPCFAACKKNKFITFLWAGHMCIFTYFITYAQHKHSK